MPSNITPNPCPACGGPVKRAQGGPVYCSYDCRQRVQREKIRGYVDNGYASLSSGTIGAIHEMAVAADLMRRGYHTFRALSPSCPCDLLAYRDTEPPLRIEVRTAHRKINGEIFRNKATKESGRYDVRALITHDGCISYDPDII